MRFMEYGTLWERWPILMLFTHGVDQLVDGSTVHNPGVHSDVDPASIVSHLLCLSDEVKSAVEGVLGHEVDASGWWNEDYGNPNRAIDVLGNLLGGNNIKRLKQFITRPPPSLHQQHGDRELELDDTTIILCDLTVLQQELDRILDGGR